MPVFVGAGTSSFMKEVMVVLVFHQSTTTTRLMQYHWYGRWSNGF